MALCTESFPAILKRKPPRPIALLLAFVLAVAGVLSASLMDLRPASAGSVVESDAVAFQVTANPNPVNSGATVKWTYTITNKSAGSLYWTADKQATQLGVIDGAECALPKLGTPQATATPTPVPSASATPIPTWTGREH